MSEMTGLERLRELGREQEERSWSTVGKVRGRLMLQIAEQIEDERLREQLAVERVASEMELHCLGVEGMDDSPVARWARELREALDAGRDPADERDAIAWVREHGGIAYVKDAWNVRRNLDRQLEKAQAKVERQQRHIESIQSKLSERREHIENIANDVRNQCLAFGVDVSECDDEFDMLHDLNEALSKRLMPVGMEWPRFQDGEPVPLGGEVTVTVHDEDGDFDRTLAIRSIKYKESGVLLEGTKNEMVVLSYGECVKRPAPKVLDADGVEIREKRDVWWICEGDERGVHAERLRVETICPNGLVECSPYNGGTWVYLEPSELYVNKPVPASDGRPLREGETVWDVYGQGPLVVRALPSEGEQLAVLDNGGTNFYRYPEKLTHERPDSWERMEEDCAKSDVDYCAERGLLDPSCDTVEGDASTRHCTDCGCTCGEKMARDLVRRAKALAERGA